MLLKSTALDVQLDDRVTTTTTKNGNFQHPRGSGPPSPLSVPEEKPRFTVPASLALDAPRALGEQMLGSILAVAGGPSLSSIMHGWPHSGPRGPPSLPLRGFTRHRRPGVPLLGHSATSGKKRKGQISS